MTAPIPGQPAISAAGLQKSFGGKVVLDGIDLAVAEGTIFALLGPNGAGKTTAVQILPTLIPADAGDLRVAGHDLATEPDAVRAAIGVTGQFSAVYDLLTGQENLILMADLAQQRSTKSSDPSCATRTALTSSHGPDLAKCSLLMHIDYRAPLCGQNPVSSPGHRDQAYWRSDVKRQLTWVRLHSSELVMLRG